MLAYRNVNLGTGITRKLPEQKLELDRVLGAGQVDPLLQGADSRKLVEAAQKRTRYVEPVVPHHQPPQDKTAKDAKADALAKLLKHPAIWAHCKQLLGAAQETCAAGKQDRSSKPTDIAATDVKYAEPPCAKQCAEALRKDPPKPVLPHEIAAGGEGEAAETDSDEGGDDKAPQGNPTAAEKAKGRRNAAGKTKATAKTATGANGKAKARAQAKAKGKAKPKPKACGAGSLSAISALENLAAELDKDRAKLTAGQGKAAEAQSSKETRCARYVLQRYQSGAIGVRRFFWENGAQKSKQLFQILIKDSKETSEQIAQHAVQRLQQGEKDEDVKAWAMNCRNKQGLVGTG